MPQIALNLPVDAQRGGEEFIPAACNQAAYELVTGFPDKWVGNTLLIVGGGYSGKTHLSLIWKDISGADFINSGQFSGVLASEIKNNLIIENIDELEGRDEEPLFHIYNRCREAGKYLLLTSRKPVYELSFTLPDLKSRISGSLIALIEQPSEEFCKTMFHKFFLDRQVQVSDKVIDYITPRTARSFRSVYEIADLLNKKSVETKRPISIPFVKETLSI